MRYTVLIDLESDRLPQNILDEIVSTLEFDPATNAVVKHGVVMVEDGADRIVATFEKED